MPFAGYENFDACVTDQTSRGKSQDVARRICGKLQSEYKKKEAIDSTSLPNSVANREQGVNPNKKRNKKDQKAFNIVLDLISRSFK